MSRSRLVQCSESEFSDFQNPRLQTQTCCLINISQSTGQANESGDDGDGDANADADPSQNAGISFGPSSLQGLFGWHWKGAEALFSGDDGLGALAKLSNYHVVVTSEFSGMGTAELATHAAIEGIRDQCRRRGVSSKSSPRHYHQNSN